MNAPSTLDSEAGDTAADRPHTPRQLVSVPLVHARRGGASNKGVLLAAIVGGSLFAAIAAVAIINTMRAPRTPPTTQGAAPTATTNAPDAQALSPSGPGASAQGAEFFAQLLDRTDPTRIEADIRAARSKPLDARTQELTQPVAWIALRDGRLIYARAERGQVRLSREARSSSLENGELEGDVLVLIFAAGQVNPNPDSTPPLARLTTDALTIDWTQGELRIPSLLRATLDQMLFEGSDVTARFDPVTNDLLFAHVASTKQLTITPRSFSQMNQAASSPATPPVAGTASSLPIANTISPLARVESLFRLNASGNVRIKQAARTLSTPALAGWLRLADGALPRPLATNRQTATAPQQGQLAQPAPSAPLVSPAESPASRVASNDAILATWTGPLEIRRLPAPPDELTNDDLWLSATAPDAASPNVIITDDQLGLTAQGRTATIAATQGEFMLITPVRSPSQALGQAVTSQSPSQDAGELSLKGLGSMRATTLRANFNANTANATGQGQLTLDQSTSSHALDGLLATQSTSTPDNPPATIRWSRGAEFTFAPATATTSPTITKAQFVGDVRAENEAAIIEGDTLIAAFVQSSRPSASSTPRISDVWVQGQAALRAKPRDTAEAADGGQQDAQPTTQPGWLRAQLVHAKFIESSNELSSGSPRIFASRLSASGQVRVEQQSQSVRSDDLLIDFLSPEMAAAQRTLAQRQGEPDGSSSSTAPTSTLALGEIARIEATGNVQVESIKDALLAKGHRLIAVPSDQTYVLSSEAADQGYSPVLAVKDGASVLAPSITINIASRSLEATGPGTIGYGLEQSPGMPASSPSDPVAKGSFAKSLSVQDALGTATLLGDATIRYASEPGSLQTLSAPSLTVQFVPTDQSRTNGSNVTATSQAGGLRTVDADGTARPGMQSPPAASLPTSVDSSVRATTHAFAPNNGILLSPRAILALNDEALATTPATQYLSLESTRILADIEANTINVPTAGTLRVADLSLPREPSKNQTLTDLAQPFATEPTPIDAMLDSQAGNVASFRWTNSLTLAPEPGTSPQTHALSRPLIATMIGGVQMMRIEMLPAASINTQQPLRQLTELTCDRLIANFMASSSDATNAASTAQQLRSVRATTNVWARTQGRELTAALLTFDPFGNQIDAEGQPNLPVALSNPGGTLLLAQRVLWNTRTGRVDVLQPIVTAAP